jgi:predicted RecB family nuclease
MQLQNGALLFSASDLVHFLECEHLTALDLLHSSGELPAAQKTELDESAALIARKGNEHERAYLDRLRADGRIVVDIAADGGSTDEKVARTIAAMQSGVDVIYQATLRDGQLFGHADFLLRVDGEASVLGTWGYEVADTKLARTPKAKFLVQLAFYSRLLAIAQGVEPRRMHVVLGDQTQRSFRGADYMHYFNALLARFRTRITALVAGETARTYGLPCGYCDLCHWRERCKAQLVADDHLCQVANIRRTQWVKLQEASINTLAKLAGLAADAIVPRLHQDTFVKLQSQAALQVYARRTGERKYLVLPLDPDARRGFFRMPCKDPGDMFFDMEGDPLEIGGLEYLFGVGFFQDGDWTFKPFWAHSRSEERVAFQQFMDFVTQRRRVYPDAHIYHYASYEESALKRLSSLHATREVEVDNLLRQGALVDLYKVVREGLRISEPSYSIKYVEHFYRPAREGDVQNAGASIVYYERWRETQDGRLLQDIEDYNRDDVDSTLQLRDWLLTLRPVGVPWKAHPVLAEAGETGSGGQPTKTQLAEQRLIPYRERLVDVLPSNQATWTVANHASELAWQLLDFHRRAEKPGWWELFTRMDMTEEELLEDPECLAGLVADPTNPPELVKKSTVYTYLAPEQETKLSDGDSCTRTDTAESLGNVSFDEASRRVRIKLGPKKGSLPARLSIGPTGPLASAALIDAVYRFADSKLAQDGRYLALERLLLREPPRLNGRRAGQPVITPGEDLVKGSIEAALAMDHTCLYVQGPPGSGKTYTGSRMIVGLLNKGWRVGITSNSHKAINNLLAGVVTAATEQRCSFNIVKKASAQNADSEYDDPRGGVENVHKNEDALASGAQLVAGTAWLFADLDADQQFDALFVDEAGQVALANLIAAGTCARNIVLLGDQMQLSQPVQGVHPGRSGDSALDYLLDGESTIAPDRGIFLATSWRMDPEVCRFISDAVYEGRLQPEAGNVRRKLVLRTSAHHLLKGSGIVHAAIEHKGCAQRSAAEAELVEQIYQSALQQRYTDRDGVEHPMAPDNILVVAPYNVQVNLLKRTLPTGARVGTVDKFQGQEAELVIVSMTTSSEQDLPRNIEFLYSKNRLNVAVSRARCTAIVIANPALMAIKCQTPEQMALVNLLCWVAEVGRLREFP